MYLTYAVLYMILVAGFVIRVNIVSRYRINMMHNNYPAYKCLPSFEAMIFKFWHRMDWFKQK